jgi:hypothetical protein
MDKLVERLAVIQSHLKAPKGQFNGFGKYSYRSCEDILEAVKPLLNGLVLTINDDVQLVGDRIYIKAVASVTDGSNTIGVTGWAREALNKKGMDESQITGCASSYARKYALNGLFCIDDTKDADANEHNKAAPKPPVKQKITPGSKLWESAKAAFIRDGNFEKVLARADISEANQKLIVEEINNA